jgi:hypothetical protein
LKCMAMSSYFVQTSKTGQPCSVDCWGSGITFNPYAATPAGWRYWPRSAWPHRGIDMIWIKDAGLGQVNDTQRARRKDFRAFGADRIQGRRQCTDLRASIDHVEALPENQSSEQSLIGRVIVCGRSSG